MTDDTTISPWEAAGQIRLRKRLPAAPRPIDRLKRWHDIAVGIGIAALALLLMYDAWILARIVAP